MENKIYTKKRSKLPIFRSELLIFRSNLPIFHVKSVKIYTGQFFFYTDMSVVSVTNMSYEDACQKITLRSPRKNASEKRSTLRCINSNPSEKPESGNTDRRPRSSPSTRLPARFLFQICLRGGSELIAHLDLCTYPIGSFC